MKSLISDLHTHFPADRVIADELRRLAWGTDASFYRLPMPVFTGWYRAS